MSASTPVGRLARLWQDLWFRTIPPHSYAVLRAAFGMLGLISLLGVTPVPLFWDLDGLIPLPGGGTGARAWIAGAGLGSVAGWTFFLALFAAFACMVAGVQVQVAVVAAFVGSVLQKLWNPLPLSSAHQVLVVVLFALVWADCGQVMTIRWWRARRQLADPSEVRAEPIWPLRLIQYQIALIYLNSGLWKLFGATWRDGTAVHYALNHNVFQRFPLATPPNADWLVAVGTYVTLIWEIAFPALVVWRPTRTLALVLGVLLHVGVWATLEVGPFSWMMIASYLAFLDPAYVARVVDRLWGAAQRGTGDTAGETPAPHEATPAT